MAIGVREVLGAEIVYFADDGGNDFASQFDQLTDGVSARLPAEVAGASRDVE